MEQVKRFGSPVENEETLRTPAYFSCGNNYVHARALSQRIDEINPNFAKIMMEEYPDDKA